MTSQQYADAMLQLWQDRRCFLATTNPDLVAYNIDDYNASFIADCDVLASIYNRSQTCPSNLTIIPGSPSQPTF